MTSIIIDDMKAQVVVFELTKKLSTPNLTMSLIACRVLLINRFAYFHLFISLRRTAGCVFLNITVPKERKFR